MQPLNRAVIVPQDDATLWIGVRPREVLGNMLSAMLWTQQSEVATFSNTLINSEIHEIGFELAMSASVYNITTKIDDLADEMPGRMNAVDLVDPRYVICLNRWFAALRMKDAVAENWGYCMREYLRNARGKKALTARWVWAPALGYPRDWYEYSGGTSQPFGLVPTIESALPLAMLLLELDRPVWESSLFPALRGEVDAQLGVQTPRGQASMAWTIHGVLQLAAFYAGYILAAMDIIDCFNRRALETVLSVAIPLYPMEARVLEAELAAIKTMREGKARHTLSYWLEDALGRGKGDTRFGVLPVITYEEGKISWPAVPTTRENGQLTCGSALLLERVRALYIERPVGVFCADDSSMQEALANAETPRQFVRGLTAIPEHFRASIERVVSLLKWRRISAEDWSVNYRGANFNLCNGHKYRHSPVAAMLGLQPVLSLGNISAWARDERRYENNFPFGGAPITVCTLVAPIAGKGEYAQYQTAYLPEGMLMGENDVSAAFIPVAGEGLPSDIAAFYATLAGDAKTATGTVVPAHVFMRPPYGKLVFNMPGGTQTDWDAQVVAADPTAVATAVHNAAGTERVPAKGEGGATYVMGLQPFMGRFPILVHPDPEAHVVSAKLGVRRRVVVDGHVAFNGELDDLTKGPEALAALTTAVIAQAA